MWWRHSFLQRMTITLFAESDWSDRRSNVRQTHPSVHEPPTDRFLEPRTSWFGRRGRRLSLLLLDGSINNTLSPPWRGIFLREPTLILEGRGLYVHHSVRLPLLLRLLWSQASTPVPLGFLLLVVLEVLIGECARVPGEKEHRVSLGVSPLYGST